MLHYLCRLDLDLCVFSSTLSGVTTILLFLSEFVVINPCQGTRKEGNGIEEGWGVACRHNEAEKVQFLVIITLAKESKKSYANLRVNMKGKKAATEALRFIIPL